MLSILYPIFSFYSTMNVGKAKQVILLRYTYQAQRSSLAGDG